MPARIFYSFADRDLPYLEALERHMAPLESQGLVKGWSAARIRPGEIRRDGIDRHLREADVIVLLVSADYFADDECARQMKGALERMREGVPVVPVLLRSVLWEMTPLAGLQPVPKGRPVRSSREEDRAWLEVVQGIVAVLGAGAQGAPQPNPPPPQQGAPAAGPVDIGILIGLREEFKEFHDLARREGKLDVERGSGAQEIYYRLRLRGPDASSAYACVAVMTGELSESGTALATQALLRRFAPRSLVLLGLATGLNREVRLGDVVVASQVDSYLRSAAAVAANARKPGFDLKRAGQVYRPSADLLAALRNFEFTHFDLYEAWRRQCSADLEQSVPRPADRELQRGLGHLGDLVRLVEGSLASGPIAEAEGVEFVRWLKERDRQYLALEMESAGLLEAVYQGPPAGEPVRTLVLRGIADLGDERQGQMDRAVQNDLALRNGVRRFAIRNCVRLLQAVLLGGVLPKAVMA